MCQWQFDHFLGWILCNVHVGHNLAVSLQTHISNKHKIIKVFTHQKTPLAEHKAKPTAAPGSRWLRGDASDSNQCV